MSSIPLQAEKIQEENLLLRALCSPGFRWLRHLLPLLILASIIHTPEFKAEWQPFIQVIALIYMLIIPYLNMYVLIPRLLLRARYFSYGIAAFCSMLACYILLRLSEPVLSPFLLKEKAFSAYNFSDVLTFFVFLAILLFASTAIKLLQHWVMITHYNAILRNLSLQAELDSLKKQLSPHFLFNTLNNLDVLIYTDQHKASTLVHKFSDLLRYQLYASNDGLVNLGKEIDFIRDFLYLECIRRDALEINMQIGAFRENTKVHALLFLPFIENAVKHNNYAGAPTISLNLYEEEGKLYFSCKNTFRPLTYVLEGGTGLKNIQRRLKLLYPHRHQLSLHQNDAEYEVQLILQL
ncbi:sensor histidine kinase [Pedobacter nutrimenti]|uniref:Histidine kinase n=1 Tax=Pedobacter nutrimenti TaxID=1241337 RepID=A0A318UT51_9SPHI|nr:histidine kinase [Pedobacter nutrimenti]PYF77275.1 histidine kinase [Pedobacter nutrimenti]